MNLLKLILVSVIVGLAVIVNYVAAQKDDSSTTPGTDLDTIWKTCRNQDIENPDLTLASEYCMPNVLPQSTPKPPPGRKGGKNKIKNKKKPKLQNNWCFRACQLKQLGWVYDQESDDADDDSSIQVFNRTKALNSVKEIFPSEIHIRLQYGILKCAKSDAAEGLTTQQCRSYAKLVRCIDTAVRRNCQTPKRSSTSTTTEAPDITPDEDEETSSPSYDGEDGSANDAEDDNDNEDGDGDEEGITTTEDPDSDSQ